MSKSVQEIIDATLGAPDTPTPPTNGRPETIVQIMVRFWREMYDPVFMRGSSLYSAKQGREVRRSELAVTSALVDLLTRAMDAPRNKKGFVQQKAIPKAIGTWREVAWGDLVIGLPQEPDSSEAVPMAQEEFVAKLTTALSTPLTLDKRTEGQDLAQRRSLVGWANLFAPTNGPVWQRVRDYAIWSRRVEGTVQIALRVQVFAVVGFPDFKGLTPRTFASLCELYQVGVRGKVAGGSIRTVLLSAEFLETLHENPVE